jgi:hypothetical protein
MSNFSNHTQAVFAAAIWVFGGDGSLSAEEKNTICEKINSSSSPWSISPDDEDSKWVRSVYRRGDLTLSDVVEAIEKDMCFSQLEKFQLYRVVCGTMHRTGNGDNGDDGWSRANELREAIGIDADDYNDWVNN